MTQDIRDDLNEVFELAQCYESTSGEPGSDLVEAVVAALYKAYRL